MTTMMLNRRLQRLCKDHIRYQSLPQERPAQKGDLVSVKWSGALEDGSRVELPETYQILLGPEKENDPFGPVVKSLYGKAIGATFSEKIAFSSDYNVPALAGKTVVIEGKVENIQEWVTFELNDDFAKEFNQETLEDLRKAVRRNIEFESEKISYLYTKRNLLDTLDAQYDFDLPPTKVENEFKAIWNQLQKEMAEAKASGEPEEDYANRPEEDLKAEYRAIAVRRVRLGLLISHLADAHKLRLNDEEVRLAIFHEAVKFPEKSSAVVKYYVDNPQALRNLVAPLIEDKVVDIILKEANVTEQSINFATLKKMVKGVIPSPYDDEEEDNTSAALTNGQ